MTGVKAGLFTAVFTPVMFQVVKLTLVRSITIYPAGNRLVQEWFYHVFQQRQIYYFFDGGGQQNFILCR